MNNIAIFCRKNGYKTATTKGGGGLHCFIRSILLSMTARTKIFTITNLGEKCLRKDKLEAIEARIDTLR